ncbi:MAG TPA: stage III sporulation protein AD [Syntrophothermus lipocalidus]|uniref:Stage III sporulation protein AD n=1 Tax=Syntrophothermus lipocalidus (strain DSM 12680 / TGB-C1) TaxID=643648 RepID=D7CKG6_SYNLT|nr:MULTISPECIES: stage III sporulation protein AD [Syntrophothermus]ADI01201.1 stage III sporulation protein AD [Syntrophothermus lipocalidus DSM 12680]NSW81871.1 stage III sporulation protein AD [Syntrophothermus sp.]HHV77594.1 stage III sporulation protein AD [Syntrophothermus lipocalidus]HOV43677.1 stage III sporulation protein AD [Syntrophothermus lipocalidus]
MEIARLVGIALVTTVFLMFLRQEKPQIAVLLSIAFGIVVFFMIIGKLFSVVQVVSQLSRKAEVNFFFVSTVLKILGVAYLAEFASVICRDAGEQAVAQKVEFAAKVIIAVLALPILVAILESIMDIMPG